MFALFKKGFGEVLPILIIIHLKRFRFNELSRFAISIMKAHEIAIVLKGNNNLFFMIDQRRMSRYWGRDSQSLLAFIFFLIHFNNAERLYTLSFSQYETFDESNGGG